MHPISSPRYSCRAGSQTTDCYGISLVAVRPSRYQDHLRRRLNVPFLHS